MDTSSTGILAMTGSPSEIVYGPSHQFIEVVQFDVAGQGGITVVNSQRLCRNPSGLRLGLLCTTTVPRKPPFCFYSLIGWDGCSSPDSRLQWGAIGGGCSRRDAGNPSGNS